jgi:hypothetical protein
MVWVHSIQSACAGSVGPESHTPHTYRGKAGSQRIDAHAVQITPTHDATEHQGGEDGERQENKENLKGHTLATDLWEPAPPANVLDVPVADGDELRGEGLWEVGLCRIRQEPGVGKLQRNSGIAVVRGQGYDQRRDAYQTVTDEAIRVMSQGGDPNTSFFQLIHSKFAKPQRQTGFLLLPCGLCDLGVQDANWAIARTILPRLPVTTARCFSSLKSTVISVVPVGRHRFSKHYALEAIATGRGSPPIRSPTKPVFRFCWHDRKPSD